MQIPFFRRMGRWGAAHPFWYYTAPLVGWILFIAWGSLTTPDNLPQIEFAQFDKVEHFSCYGLLAVLLLRGWVRQGPVRLGPSLLVWLVAAAWGLYLEFMQRLAGYRTFDLWDAASNASGALLGLTAWAVLTRVIAIKNEDPAL